MLALCGPFVKRLFDHLDRHTVAAHLKIERCARLRASSVHIGQTDAITSVGDGAPLVTSPTCSVPRNKG